MCAPQNSAPLPKLRLTRVRMREFSQPEGIPSGTEAAIVYPVAVEAHNVLDLVNQTERISLLQPDLVYSLCRRAFIISLYKEFPNLIHYGGCASTDITD